MSQLLEQLQNEKATVSRAIAQNLELKEQLAELQDKLIMVTNESAAKEDERTSALANIKLFKQQIEELVYFIKLLLFLKTKIEKENRHLMFILTEFFYIKYFKLKKYLLQKV